MKVLLLIPPTDLKKSYGKLKIFSNPQPSIGIAYISAVLREDGHDVKIVDAYVGGHSLLEIMENIKQYEPGAVGISVLTPSAEVVYEISRHIRIKFPDIKIIMGNMHASLFSDEILFEGHADFVVHREGEFTMRELVRALQNNGNIDSIQGISFQRNGTIVHNPLRPHIENLDELPFPAWDLLSTTKYTTDPRTTIIKNVVERQILATRGCPNQCTFCSSRTEKSLGSKYRMREPKKVVDEMVYMYEHYGNNVFAFVDLAFPLIRRHATELCSEIINRGYGEIFKWTTECRVRPLDEELLRHMRKAGCVRVCFGIESGDNEILRMLKKNFTTDDVRYAMSMARNADLEADGMFMIGLPGETEGTIRKTIKLAIEINVRYAIFNIFVPYPGCELYATLKAENKIHFNNRSDFTSYPAYSGGTPVYTPDGITHYQLMNLQKYAMQKYYFRPKFVYQELKRLKLSQIRKYYEGFKALLLSR